jgi:hypothetical protein
MARHLSRRASQRCRQPNDCRDAFRKNSSLKPGSSIIGIISHLWRDVHFFKKCRRPPYQSRGPA